MTHQLFTISLALPILAAAQPATLQVRILDHGQPTPARVNVIGADNAYYQPDAAGNRLTGYGLREKGNRSNVGPLRYYGSFFYTDGSFEVKVPAGSTRIEVSKGYTYYRAVVDVRATAGKTSRVDITLQRMVDLPSGGWRSTDPHLHFKRETPDEDRIITDLLAAEGVDVGYIMTQASTPGYGAASRFTNRGVTITSGEELVNASLGHVNVLMANRQTLGRPEGPVPEVSAPRITLPLADIFDRARTNGGAMQHNHGGYGEEINADVVLGKSDWVELLQFGSYRTPIGLDGYYRILNSGFRYPLAGGSDYPADRALSDSLTYVAGGAGDPGATVDRLRKGQSFATSGPLIFMTVNGRAPGETLNFTGDAPRTLDVQVRAVSANLPIQRLEIVQDGNVIAEWHDAQPWFEKTLTAKVKVDRGSWVAARCSGPETAHAHTNPVWIAFDGRGPYSASAFSGLIAEIKKFATRRLSPEAAALLDRAQQREGLVPRLTATRPDPAVRHSPAVAPRPAMRGDEISGTVVDSAGHPVAEADVRINGGNPAVHTDASGRFTLRRPDAHQPLFLRIGKSGHVRTNTSYLNPAASARIVLLTTAEAAALVAQWGRTKQNKLPAEAERAIVLVDSGSHELETTAPQMTTTANQTVIVARVALQGTEPMDPDPRETNFIVRVKDGGKDMVTPVYPGQLSYIEIR